VTESTSYPIPGFTETVSSLSHLLGAGVFAVMAIFLLRRGWGNMVRVGALSVYAFTCVFLLSMSGVYHLLAIEGTARAVLGRLDHAAIFALIAGTFTPVHAILFHRLGRWGPLLLIWLAVVTAITLKSIFFNHVSECLGLSLYLGLGWIGALTGVVLWRLYGAGFVRPLVLGAGAYTVGAAFDFVRWPVIIPRVVGPHELFHVAVLAGIAWHWKFVSQFASGDMTTGKRRRPGQVVRVQSLEATQNVEQRFLPAAESRIGYRSHQTSADRRTE
jgi:channel protein (hemolysin III family)